MTEYKCLDISASDRITTVRMNREAERNSFNLELMTELTQFARAHQDDLDTVAIILRGAETFFSAGADLTMFKEKKAKIAAGNSRARLLELRKEANVGPNMCKAWEELPCVTIAAIEGHCIGGAAALAVSCDFRIVGQSAFMSLPEVPLGINMSWHTIPRLVAMMGPSRTKRMVMFGEKFGARTLEAAGCADDVVSDGEAYETAMKWARNVSALPPLPVRMTKQAVNAVANANAYASTYMDSDQYLLTSLSEDFDEGVMAFLEKRQPKFKGN